MIPMVRNDKFGLRKKKTFLSRNCPGRRAHVTCLHSLFYKKSSACFSQIQWNSSNSTTYSRCTLKFGKWQCRKMENFKLFYIRFRPFPVLSILVVHVEFHCTGTFVNQIRNKNLLQGVWGDFVWLRTVFLMKVINIFMVFCFFFKDLYVYLLLRNEGGVTLKRYRERGGREGGLKSIQYVQSNLASCRKKTDSEKRKILQLSMFSTMHSK